MKRSIYFSLILAILPLTHQKSIGQTYEFSVSSQPYVEMAGGIDLVGSTWDDTSFVVAIPFDFSIFSQEVMNLYMRDDFSFIILSDDPGSDTVTSLLVNIADLVDRGYLDGEYLSPITYHIEGSPGNRKITVQWKNAGFYWDLLTFGTSTDFINFQVKLHESSGDIEYHFGPNQINEPQIVYPNGVGPQVGMVEEFDTFTGIAHGEVLLLTGNPVAPAVQTTFQDATLSGPVPANTVYRFFNTLTATDEISAQSATSYYFPNPTTGVLYPDQIISENITSQVIVQDASGAIIQIKEKGEVLDLREFPAGIYSLSFETKKGKQSQKVYRVH